MRTATGRKIVLLERTTVVPLTCVDVRGRGVVDLAARRKPKPDTWAVVTATILSAAAFEVLCEVLLYWSKVSYSSHVYYKHVTLAMLGIPEVLGALALAVMLFMFAYPLMGLFVAFLCGELGAAIVRIYKLRSGGRAHPNTFLLFVASWPVMIWTIPLLVFAWGLGIVCRFFWK